MVLNNEDDSEVFRGFAAQDIAVVTANINKSLVEKYDNHKHFINQIVANKSDTIQ